MRRILFTFVGVFLSFSSLAMQFAEDQQYVRIDRLVATNKPELIEFFSFYCSYCYQFDQIYHISSMIKKALPTGTKMIKYHVDFLGPMGKQLTQAWAVAIVLGIEDKVGPLLFEGIQKAQTIQTPKDICNVFSKLGISAKEYDSTWNSFVVKSLVAQQEKAAADLQLRSVPTMLVNGKYMVKNDGLDISSIDIYANQLADIIKFLISQK